MKKSFLLLPLSVAILSACTSNTQAPITSTGGELSPGIMQPVNGGNANGSWQPEIQQNTMPSMPAGVQSPQPNFQPTYQQPAVVNQPTFQPIQKPTIPTTATQPQTKTVTKTVSDCVGSQNINIPRNPNTNAPDYSQIEKGSYKGNTYKVNKGDTMFLIAYLSGMDVKELAALNNMREPYSLMPGQILKVSNCSTKTVTTTVPVTTTTAKPTAATTSAATVTPAQPIVTYTPGAHGTQIGSDGSIIGPVKSGVGTSTPTPNFPPVATASTGTIMPATTPSTPVTNTNNAPINENVTAPIASNVAWQWPTSMHTTIKS